MNHTYYNLRIFGGFIFFTSVILTHPEQFSHRIQFTQFLQFIHFVQFTQDRQLILSSNILYISKLFEFMVLNTAKMDYSNLDILLTILLNALKSFLCELSYINFKTFSLYSSAFVDSSYAIRE